MLSLLENKFEQYRLDEIRFAKGLKWIYILSAVIHVLFFLFFFNRRITELYVFNIFSPILYLFCWYLSIKGKLTLPASLAIIEASVHGYLCTYLLGWESGFYYYVFLVFFFIFFLLRTSLSIKVFISLPFASALVWLFLYSSQKVPKYVLDIHLLEYLNLINLLLIIFSIGAFAVLYTIFIRLIENELTGSIAEMEITQENLNQKITENSRVQRMLIKEKALLDSLMENIPDFIYFKDREGKFLRVSKSLAELFKINDPDKMVGKTDFDFYHKQVADKYSSIEKEIMETGIPIINEIVYETLPDKKEHWLAITKMLLVDDTGKQIGTFGISTDITEIKKLQMEAVKYAGELKMQENELKNREEEQRLLNLQKNKFFSIFSHDLKNPLNSLNGFTELLWMNYDNYDDARKKKLFGEIFKLVVNIKSLIVNLLEWSRSQMDNLKLNPDNIGIYDLIIEAVMLEEMHQREKGIHLKIEVKEDQTVYADQHIVYTVIRNLYSNAVKYTNPGGNILVRADTEDNEVRISFTDDGIGMSKEEMSQLFHFGGHTRPGTSKEKGSGVGLIVCKEYLERCNGSIHIESEPGKGSSLTVILPHSAPENSH